MGNKLCTQFMMMSVCGPNSETQTVVNQDTAKTSTTSLMNNSSTLFSSITASNNFNLTATYPGTIYCNFDITQSINTQTYMSNNNVQENMQAIQQELQAQLQNSLQQLQTTDSGFFSFLSKSGQSYSKEDVENVFNDVINSTMSSVQSTDIVGTTVDTNNVTITLYGANYGTPGFDCPVTQTIGAEFMMINVGQQLIKSTVANTSAVDILNTLYQYQHTTYGIPDLFFILAGAALIIIVILIVVHILRGRSKNQKSDDD